MGLSNTQYREILNEYDRIRQDNYRMEQDRIAEVYAKVPAIEQMNLEIASVSMAAARSMLFHPDQNEKSLLHDKIASLSKEKRHLLVANHFPEDYLDPIYTCSACKDTGYINDRKCACFEAKIREILYQQSNLRDSLREQNFGMFRTDYYSSILPEGKKASPRENILKVLDTSYNFIDHFSSEPGQNLLIYGNPGVGKTFLTTCIAGEILKQGHSVLYLTAHQLFEQLAQATFQRNEENLSFLPALMDADLLIIDDLGTEMNNAFINSQLFLCINERILKKRSTIISTNLSFKQIHQNYTERISSRLIQFYILLHIYGEDIRIKKAFSTID